MSEELEHLLWIETQLMTDSEVHRLANEVAVFLREVAQDKVRDGRGTE